MSKKRIAAIVTHYRPNSHADVILGKILEGYHQDGGPGPELELASMYMDQFPEQDLSRSMSKKHNVPLFQSIEEAITLGQSKIPVDGVLIIGEHGDYPDNEKGQKLYPRRAWFEEVTNVLAKYNKVLPIFNDKHLSVSWQDAQWMVQRARDMHIPFMAGSSLPLSFRKPEYNPPMGCHFDSVMGVGYSGLDIYGIHALEVFQCIVERRENAEKGVRWVQCLQGDAMWDYLESNPEKRELLRTVLEAIPHSGTSHDLRKRKELQHGQVALFRFSYVDGLDGSIAMLAGVAAGNGFAVRLSGETEIRATHIEERPTPYPHFMYLVKAIETLMHTGHSPYPVERTMLTTGVHDMLLTSRHYGGRKIQTPFLKVSYQPVDYPHAPEPVTF